MNTINKIGLVILIIMFVSPLLYLISIDIKLFINAIFSSLIAILLFRISAYLIKK